jgi:ABC-type sugar transport system permease subunit
MTQLIATITLAMIAIVAQGAIVTTARPHPSITQVFVLALTCAAAGATTVIVWVYYSLQAAVDPNENTSAIAAAVSLVATALVSVISVVLFIKSRRDA